MSARLGAIVVARRSLQAAWRESLYRRIVVESWRSSPGLLIAFVSCVLLGAAAAVGFVIAVGAIVGSVPDAARRGPGSQAARDVEVAVVIAIALVLVQPLLAALQRAVGGALGRAVEGAARRRVMVAALTPATVTHLQDPDVAAEIVDATRLGAAHVGAWAAVENFGPVLASLVTGLAMCVVVATFRWWMGLALAIVWMYARRNRWNERLKRQELVGKQGVGTRRQGYFRALGTTPGAAKEIRIFGLQGWLLERFSIDWWSAMRKAWATRRSVESSTWSMLAVLAGVNAVAVIVMARAAARGDLGGGALVVLLQAVAGARVISEPGSANFHDLLFTLGTSTLSSVERLEARLGIGDGAPRGRGRAGTERLTDSIVFDAVTFAYPGRERAVFEGLDLSIPAGTSLALVGDNGAGKTTLVRLLLGLVEPSSGAIRVDGRALSALEVERWRTQVAVVFQDFLQFPVTLRENIELGVPEGQLDDTALRGIIDRAGLRDVAAGLPSGAATVLSRQRTAGVELSGGEWQRVALARALAAVHGGASVLVMDEPTASLDIRAEAAFYDQFLELTRGLTTLVISHRFATVRRADRIALIEGGVISELGSHAALMARDGKYARQFRLQADAFHDERGEGGDGDA